MKFRKLVFECGIIAASAVIISGSSAVSVSAAETAKETVTTGTEQDETESKDLEEKEDASDSDVQENDGEVTDEAVTDADDEASEWENKLLVIVDEDSSLNVREEASTDSDVVGKMYRGSAAEIVEKGDEWTKIVSGDVEGYVKNEYCLFAEEAEAQAEEICETVATVTADGVRLRGGASTEATIYSVLSEGDSLTAAEDVEETSDEWVAVEYGGDVAYISADYVDVELEIGEAVSMKEIYEQQAAEAAKKAAASSTSSSASSTSSGTAVSASSDDTTLLAALIQCEAGGESYAGQLAVGAVVMNRVKSGSFPNTISGVIYQSGQFSPASSGKLSRVLSSGSISSSCYQAAKAAIAGEDNTGGAKYFHAGSGSGTVIGNQVFY